MKNIGLALGGGAVLGAAHIGVLRAIDENSLKIRYVSGTSIGAFVGALYAFGLNWEKIKSLAANINWMDLSSITLSRYGLLSNEKLGDFLIEHIGDVNIEDSPIPLAIISTNITTGEKVTLTKGSVANAVMASTCIPGVFRPIEINGSMLVDGGIVENVPVKTAADLGAEFIIGVDLNAKHTFDKPEGIIDVLLNSFHFLMQQTDKLQTKSANVLIKPDLNKFNWTSMNQINDLIDQGYKDSKEILSNLIN